PLQHDRCTPLRVTAAQACTASSDAATRSAALALGLECCGARGRALRSSGLALLLKEVGGLLVIGDRPLCVSQRLPVLAPILVRIHVIRPQPNGLGLIGDRSFVVT